MPGEEVEVRLDWWAVGFSKRVKDCAVLLEAGEAVLLARERVGRGGGVFGVGGLGWEVGAGGGWVGLRVWLRWGEGGAVG